MTLTASKMNETIRILASYLVIKNKKGTENSMLRTSCKCKEIFKLKIFIRIMTKYLLQALLNSE